MGTAPVSEELINPGRQANIHWRCNLGEKEADSGSSSDGEPGAQAQAGKTRIQQRPQPRY